MFGEPAGKGLPFDDRASHFEERGGQLRGGRLLGDDLQCLVDTHIASDQGRQLAGGRRQVARADPGAKEARSAQLLSHRSDQGGRSVPVRARPCVGGSDRKRQKLLVPQETSSGDLGSGLDDALVGLALPIDGSERECGHD